ncbi:MAG: NIPSNAP family protein [Hyphomonadaceae bacterium]
MRSLFARSLIALACLAFAACTTAVAQPPANNTPLQMNLDEAGQRSPVRNLSPVPGQEITTIRYWKIKKGTFPQFLKASQDGIWPYFEKIGARIVGMWQVIPPPNGKEASPDYDEVYLTTRYASLAHWAATRDAAAMGGDGPDYAALQAALAIRQSLTIETKVTFMQGVVGPLAPVYMPGTGEKFVPAP